MKNKTKNKQQTDKKPNVTVAELLFPDIYELQEELSDGTFLVRINQECAGTLMEYLGEATIHLNAIEKLGRCILLLEQICNQRPSIKTFLGEQMKKNIPR